MYIKNLKLVRTFDTIESKLKAHRKDWLSDYSSTRTNHLVKCTEYQVRKCSFNNGLMCGKELTLGILFVVIECQVDFSLLDWMKWHRCNLTVTVGIHHQYSVHVILPIQTLFLKLVKENGCCHTLYKLCIFDNKVLYPLNLCNARTRIKYNQTLKFWYPPPQIIPIKISYQPHVRISMTRQSHREDTSLTLCGFHLLLM